jgi:hypothetical protein
VGRPARARGRSAERSPLVGELGGALLQEGLDRLSQGDVQLLANGDVFAGWGQLPEFSEYSASGTLLHEGALGVPDESYRTFRATWVRPQSACRARSHL